jgi:hypothetical protein
MFQNMGKMLKDALLGATDNSDHSDDDRDYPDNDSNINHCLGYLMEQGIKPPELKGYLDHIRDPENPSQIRSELEINCEVLLELLEYTRDPSSALNDFLKRSDSWEPLSLNRFMVPNDPWASFPASAKDPIVKDFIFSLQGFIKLQKPLFAIVHKTIEGSEALDPANLNHTNVAQFMCKPPMPSIIDSNEVLDCLKQGFYPNYYGGAGHMGLPP